MGWSRKTKSRIKTAGIYLGLIAFSIGLIFPLLWMISTSFKPTDEIFTRIPRWIPKKPTFDNYLFLLFKTDYQVFFRNTIKISIITTIAAPIVAIFAGYSLSRFKFKGRGYLGVLIIAVQMFPYVLLVIPLFTVMRAVGLIDTHISLVIAYGTFALPFSAWMLKGYFDTIPVSLEEAAIIDGCSRLQVLFRIVLPLSAPGLVAVAMFAFILAWQEYIYALAFLRSSNMRTLTIGLAMMQGQHGRISWGQIMAGSFLACIPPILVFTFFQRFIVQGFTRGAVKE
jgi:ABC-type glycerol-3-phosphate transport system permease component